MLADARRLRRGVAAARRRGGRGEPIDRLLAQLRAEIDRSTALRQRRQRGVPRVTFPDELPISQRRDDIARAIRANQVVVVSGQTGSGKSTQLPKICLSMGRGVGGLIGQTQPRRIAARTVASRIAQELGSPVGRAVGHKVRFSDQTRADTYVKVMTDGILLAEIQGDPLLERYDTIIIDEAHERSLNIDFLLGYFVRFLPRRPDLRLIITSATIDPERFSRHFALGGSPTPIIEVSGRTWPVEVRYRPVEAPSDQDESGHTDEHEDALEGAVVRAVEDLLSAPDTGDGGKNG